MIRVEQYMSAKRTRNDGHICNIQKAPGTDKKQSLRTNSKMDRGGKQTTRREGIPPVMQPVKRLEFMSHQGKAGGWSTTDTGLHPPAARH